MGAVIAIVALVALGAAAVVVAPSCSTAYECVEGEGGGCTCITMSRNPSPLEGSPAVDGLPYSQQGERLAARARGLRGQLVQGGAAAP